MPAAPKGEIGHYHAATREIFVSLAAASIDTLAHEVAHPLLDADYPHAPAWLVEGIASLFEDPDFSVPGEIHGKAHFRLQTLRDALASPATRPLLRIDTLFGMSDETFRKEKPWLKYTASASAFGRRPPEGDIRLLILQASPPTPRYRPGALVTGQTGTMGDRSDREPG